MKKLLKIVGGSVAALLGLVLVAFIMQIVASETAEVVVLTSQGTSGPEETRLWVVDYQGHQYLRVGADGSGWYERLVHEPLVGVERDGKAARFQAEARPELTLEINALMQEKYGWRDSYVGALMGSREGSIPVRLNPTG